MEGSHYFNPLVSTSSSMEFLDDESESYFTATNFSEKGSNKYTENDTLYYDDEDFSFSETFQVTIYILYNTVFIAAVLGNVLVCYVVFSSPRMRTVTNYLIANLALGDLLMAVFCVPFSYIPVLYQYWPFGKIMCHVLSPAQAVCVFVSAYTLVALAGDRYMAILYPLQPRLRRSQAVLVIFIVWVIAILTAAPIAIYTGLSYDNITERPICQENWQDENLKLYYSLTLMILQYFFPLAVLIFTYTRIAVAVWGKKAPGEAEDGRDKRLAKAKRKMIKMMLTVMLVYTLSWLPFNTLMVCADVQGAEFWSWGPIRYIFFAVHWMAMSHTVCNPIIYCWMNSRFRVGFRSAASQLPLLRRLLNGRDGKGRGGHRLQRMGTCTTYTFASPMTTATNTPNHSNKKLARGGSLISNRTTFSEAGSPNFNNIERRKLSPYMSTQPLLSQHNNHLSISSPYISNGIPCSAKLHSPVSMVVSYNSSSFMGSSSSNKGLCSSRRGSRSRTSISESFM